MNNLKTKSKVKFLAPIYQILLREMKKQSKGLIYSSCAPENERMIEKIGEFISYDPPKLEAHLEILIQEIVEIKDGIIAKKDNESTRKYLETLIRELDSNFPKNNSKGGTYVA